MRAACIGTVEVTVALNGHDYTGFAPPLLYSYRNEFVLHAGLRRVEWDGRRGRRRW